MNHDTPRSQIHGIGRESYHQAVTDGQTGSDAKKSCRLDYFRLADMRLVEP